MVISGDTDFGALLVLDHRISPSVILFRSRHPRTAEAQTAVLLAHLDDHAEDPDHGAITVVADDRIGVRRLPRLTQRQNPTRPRRSGIKCEPVAPRVNGRRKGFNLRLAASGTVCADH